METGDPGRNRRKPLFQRAGDGWECSSSPTTPGNSSSGRSPGSGVHLEEVGSSTSWTTAA